MGIRITLPAIAICAATAAVGGGTLSPIYHALEDGEAACFTGDVSPDGRQTTTATPALTLTKSVDNPNGTAPGRGFAFTLDLGLTGTPDTMRIHGCCSQGGFCTTGESCGDQPVVLGMHGVRWSST